MKVLTNCQKYLSYWSYLKVFVNSEFFTRVTNSQWDKHWKNKSNFGKKKCTVRFSNIH